MELSPFDKKFAESVETCVTALIGILNVLMVFTKLGWSNVNVLLELVLKHLNNLHQDIHQYERAGRPQLSPYRPDFSIGAISSAGGDNARCLATVTTASTASRQLITRPILAPSTDSDGYEIVREMAGARPRTSPRKVTFMN